MSTTAEAWLDDIIAHPGDDAPRLIFADWLEERLVAARAEFIRVQVELARYAPTLLAAGVVEITDRTDGGKFNVLRRRERELLEKHRAAWTDLVPGFKTDAWSLDEPMQPYVYGGRVLYRRGFVAEITLTLADWYGGPCGRCGGDGQAHGSDRPFEWSPDPDARKCPACCGSGRTPGHGPALVRAAPFEYVTLSDREPFAYTAGGRPTYLWRCVENGSGDERNLLPVALFDFLPGHVAEYATRQEAESALSDACLSWANAEADRAAR